ncbi:MAG: hypothetical protein WCK26_00300 [Candidatus Saccharibacteria bacterium]
MNKNKKTLIIIGLVSFFVVTAAVLGYLIISQPHGSKLIIVKSKKYSCKVENCPEMNGKTLEGSVDVYYGIKSEEECKSLEGHPIIVYFGFVGERVYLDCGVK